MKYLIVGGVAGGAGAATRLRRLDEEAEIILFEKGEYISYANCGLPYYIGGVIKEKSKLEVTKPETLKNHFNIDVRTFSEVLSIDPTSQTVEVEDKNNQLVYKESYDKLILSPGASPKIPPMEGIQLPHIFTLRNLADTFEIDQFISSTSPKDAVIIGGGFIGVEIAENLVEKGIHPIIVETSPQIIATLDFEMANILHKHVIESGVTLQLETGVASFSQEENSKKLEVHLTNGKIISTDFVILSIGVAPDTKLAKNAGIKTNQRDAIIVDDNYETSIPNIYAVGDAIEVTHLVTKKETMIPLAGPANKQGRKVAEAALGLTTYGNKKQMVQGSAVLKVFDYTAASTGLNEKQLIFEGIPYKKTYVHPSSHASYYPESTPIALKLLFGDSGEIYGAQAIGMDGVEKRIDVIATTMRLKGSVYDLTELELCYAPPYSSAKDPVNMAGFTASNILTGMMKVFYAENIPEIVEKSGQLIDVSTKEEILMGSIPNSISIPLDELRNSLSKISKEKPVYVFCRVGLRGYIAQRILTQYGFDTYNLSGGYKTYQQYHFDLKSVSGSFLVKPQETVATKPKNTTVAIEVDACGLQCPGPIMKVSEEIKKISEGDTMTVDATDPAFASDISVWCERTNNTLLGVEKLQKKYRVMIKKGGDASAPLATSTGVVQNDKTMVIFSGDLDKAMAAFIIANGAAAMDRKVTLFFTFWGLNILRKNQHVKVKKSWIEAMFGKMMPRGSKKLGLSRMNMGGIGAKMIRYVMKSKNVASLEELITAAMDQGITIIACQMSMDVMGIKPEELIDGVEIGGVATFLGSAETSDTNLFI